MRCWPILLALLPVAAWADPAADAVLADAGAACAAEGNGVLTVPPGAVMQVDLTGDTSADWLVDEAQLTCSTADGLFSGGPGGSRIHVVANGAAFSWLAQGWQIVTAGESIGTGAQPQVLLLALHGSACNAMGVLPCFQALVWGGDRFLSVSPPPG